MKRRILGRTGLAISEIGYGAWGIGRTQWKGGSDDESSRALRRAFELGINFVDTALVYGDGQSERLIGCAVRDWGQTIAIATKVPPMDGVWPAPPDASLEGVFPYKHILAATEASLRNLGVETIDLQQLHVWNPRWMHQDEWRRALEDLKSSGKIRFIGVSLTEHDADSGLDLVETGCVDALQVIYNIFDPAAAERLFPLAEQRGVGILARVPLDEGGLSGMLTEKSNFDAHEFRARYFRGDRKRHVEQRVRLLLDDLCVTPESLPEIALRFCLTPSAVTSVIPGMRSTRHVEGNVRASEAGPLTYEILSTLQRHRWARNFYM